jgi:signal transduction histidine kinase
MTASLRRRLVTFCALMIAILVLVGWSAATAWREVGRLRGRFTAAQFESFRIAGQLQSSVLDLQSGLLGYELSGEEESWSRYQRDSETLNAWIDRQRSVLKTDEEKRVLADIDKEYDHYLAVAQEVRRERNVPGANRVQQIGNAAQRMLALGGQLAEAHRRALGDFLGESQHSLQRLEALLGSGLAVILAVGAWGGQALYRETIAPLRRQLVETQELAERREKLASLGVLAAGVAHEIRNPLTAIKARLFTLQRRLEGHPLATEDAAIIDHEIDRLERIVNDFLSFARPGEPILQNVAPNDLLGEVGHLLAAELARNAIELSVDFSTETPSLEADPHQLKQVLINLVRNAAESIPRGGRVILRARRDFLPLRGRPQEVAVLEVEDNGEGIPAEIQERLFDPFFTTKPTGTGLGLSIAMRILEKHGGTLEFQTAPGRGTTFGMVLPVTEPRS